MGTIPSEIRLILSIGLSTFITMAGYRFARRRGGDVVDAMIEGLVFFYLVQYIAVGLTGSVGLLYWPVMLLVGAVLAGAIWFAKQNPHPCPLPEYRARERWVLAGCLTVMASYIAGVIWIQRGTPPLANDALTYHLPAAVDWVQHHRLTLYQTWLFNPANTYSPLAGSMFITWLLAPIGNDVLARFVQVPALLLIFFGLIQIGRNLGASFIVSTLVATIVVLSQPLIRQIMLAKDDLFVAAFFTAAIASINTSRIRAAVAVGLLLATKYTALMSLPLLLLMIDAPIRGGWRIKDWISFLAIILILAGPWFVRNLILTGNPLYPIGSLFWTARTQHGMGKALTGSYYSMRPILWAGWIIAWIGVIVRYRGNVLREPLLRACVIGPVMGIGIFVLTSPYDEVRFINPSLILLMACAASALPGLLEYLLIALIAAAALATNFGRDALLELLQVTVPLAVFGAIVVIVAGRTLHTSRARFYAAIAACLVCIGWLYVWWDAYVSGYRDSSTDGWTHPQSEYMPLAQGWAFVRTQVPPEQRLAYANTHFVYPLYGFELDRRVVYVPLRAELKTISNLPRLPGKLDGEQIEPAVVRATTANPDRDAWLKGLRDSGATVLFIGKRSLSADPRDAAPPELTFAEQEPARFQKIFENPEAVIYRFNP